MVERVSGWRTSDGRMFDNQKRAVEEEALLHLAKLDIFNEATRKAMLPYARIIVEVLEPVAAEQRKEPLGAKPR